MHGFLGLQKKEFLHLRHMFKKLQKKWNVGGLGLILILCTFAIGGSLCGYLGRKIMQMANLPVMDAWLIIYVILITFLWPLCVIIVSIPFGQFGFFKSYLQRIWIRFKKGKTIPGDRERIAIFASGSGSNALKIIEYFTNHPSIQVGLIVSNKADAGVLAHARKFAIPTLVIDKKQFYEQDAYLPDLQKKGITAIVLAGFLLKIPSVLIKNFPERIINIHPALLPAFGGRGMYGHHVHEAVLAANEAKSGITIHLVDEIYDHGKQLLQESCPVLPDDTPAILASRVLQLEHLHYAQVIEKWLTHQYNQNELKVD